MVFTREIPANYLESREKSFQNLPDGKTCPRSDQADVRCGLPMTIVQFALTIVEFCLVAVLRIVANAAAGAGTPGAAILPGGDG
jgi:hypothetical protein